MITRDNLLDALRQKLKMQAKPVKYREAAKLLAQLILVFGKLEILSA